MMNVLAALQDLPAQPGQMNEGAAMAFAGAYMAVVGLVSIVMIVSMWKVFVKAGLPGWAAIVPFYNIYMLHKISGKPTWALILCFVPCGPLPLIGFVVIGMGVAERFGKSQGFGIGLGLAGVICYPMLAFGDAQYQGPALT